MQEKFSSEPQSINKSLVSAAAHYWSHGFFVEERGKFVFFGDMSCYLSGTIKNVHFLIIGHI